MSLELFLSFLFFGRFWEGLVLIIIRMFSRIHQWTILSWTYVVVIVQSLSHVQLFVTPWTASCQASLSFSISSSLLRLVSIELVMPSNLCHSLSPSVHPLHPLSPPSLALNLSQHQGLFQWVGCLHQVGKVLELQHQSFQWIFRIDFL